MNIGDSFLLLLLKSLYKYSSNICELFWHVKTEMYIFDETPETNSYKTIS